VNTPNIHTRKRPARGASLSRNACADADVSPDAGTEVPTPVQTLYKKKKDKTSKRKEEKKRANKKKKKKTDKNKKKVE
jgi:hypothetical protein